MALKNGVSVAPKESQKPPKVVKTTAGKVLPRTHSRRPPMRRRMPAKKKY